MTELNYKIENLEIQIRTVSRSIARSKNSRQKAADVATLARLQKELEELKLLSAHDQAVKENNEVWNALKKETDAQPEAMEPLPGDEGEKSA